MPRAQPHPHLETWLPQATVRVGFGLLSARQIFRLTDAIIFTLYRETLSCFSSHIFCCQTILTNSRKSHGRRRARGGQYMPLPIRPRSHHTRSRVDMNTAIDQASSPCATPATGRRPRGWPRAIRGWPRRPKEVRMIPVSWFAPFKRSH